MSLRGICHDQRTPPRAHIAALRALRVKHPRLADGLLENWGTTEFAALLYRAAHPKRGIIDEFAEELHTIRAAHQHAFPELLLADPDSLHDLLEQNADYQRVRERFARIADEILTRWGTPEAVTYLDELLHYDEATNLDGFPPDIHAALMHLLILHDEHFPRP